MNKEELDQLDKSELVDLIYDYWIQLKTQAENDMNRDSYRMQEYARVKMTQLNRLKNMLLIKLNQNKDKDE